MMLGMMLGTAFNIFRVIVELPATLHVQQGKPTCKLAWDAKANMLWVGNLAQPGEEGKALAFQVIERSALTANG